MLKPIRLNDRIPWVNTPLRIPASEFARIYRKKVQTVHNWAKKGVIKDNCGCEVQTDVTRHLFIVVPPSHADHKTFLYRQHLALLKKPEVRRRIEQIYHDPERGMTAGELVLCFVEMFWRATGHTGLEPESGDLTLAQLEEIQTRFIALLQREKLIPGSHAHYLDAPPFALQRK
jgi:hypothetical protein